MTKRCFYCGEEVTDSQITCGTATETTPGLHAHYDCIDSHGKDGTMTMRCQYCKDVVTPAHIAIGEVVKTGRDRYAHYDCIDNHGKDETMSDQVPHILGAADSAHQGIELARSLIQESLGNMGEILTQGCMELGAAPLGSTMRLGQQLKELSSLLGSLLSNAHGLCILLGKDLGVCEGEAHPVGDMIEDAGGKRGFLMRYFPGDDELFPPGEDEYDDDEQPF